MFWKIWFWTINPFTLKGIWSVVVVESSEPKSADICGKGPLSNPDIVFDIKGTLKAVSVSIAVFTDVFLGSPPCGVEMGVHDDVRIVFIIVEHVISSRQHRSGRSRGTRI